MDAVIDISARAVSYINLIHDIILKVHLSSGKAVANSDGALNLANIFDQLIDGDGPSAAFLSWKNQAEDIFESRAVELLPICQNHDINTIEAWTFQVMVDLVRWVNSHAGEIFGQLDSSNFPTPYKWREVISEMLYKFPNRRISISKALQYLPIQLVLAVGGGKYNTEEQQVLQVWNDFGGNFQTNELNNSPATPSGKKIAGVQILSKSEVEFREIFQKGAFINYVKIISRNFLKEARSRYDEKQEEKPRLYEVFKTEVCKAIQELQLDKEIDALCNEYINKTNNVNNNKDEVLHCIRCCKEFRDKLIQYIRSREELPLQFFRRQTERLLVNDDELMKELFVNNSPLPFEMVLKAELSEIEESRRLRYYERILDAENAKLHVQIKGRKNPYLQAEDMELRAIAFSGGGIRSATFNLGILQGLAKAGHLDRLDYMSTVSGGGYIGSWLSTWIKREGSLKKVSDRLDPSKCLDPMAEEVRPIRWLRMFSNYFAPDASIMSTDSWTIGVTWVRNTLLNLVVILLLLLTVLMTGYFFYKLWHYFSGISTNLLIHVCTCLLLIASFLTGLGMNAYVKKKNSRNFVGTPIVEELTGKATGWFLRRTKEISLIVLSCGVAEAYMISAYLYGRKITYISIYSLWPIGEAVLATAICLLVVAALGRYDLCIASFEKGKKRWRIITKSIAVLLGGVGFAVLVGAICLVLVWPFLYKLNSNQTTLCNRLAFIAGVPLVLEVSSITVVARMAFLGRYFPDERREWWGRMGAIVHRLSFAWIAATSITLLGMKYIVPVIKHDLGRAVVTAGGWAAVVGLAVKAAYSSKTSSDKRAAETGAIRLNLISQIGPYVFIIGLFIFLPALLVPLIHLTNYSANYIVQFFFRTRPYSSTFQELTPILLQLPVILLMALFTYRLAVRIGVNEFSMHHFYRNRLVRAYLGATRRRTDRDKTANPFTNFDMRDDEKIAAFTNKTGYYGPYPLINAALNASQVTELDRQDRKAESFVFSPLFSGFDFSRTRSGVAIKKKSYDYGFRQTANYAFPDGPAIGTAMAISGAAVNPNQGYHSSAATAFFLTVFNLQMGWWIGNPRKASWRQSNPAFGLPYIVNNLTGKTDTRSDFVALSDGGHFDNMGLYELIRRRCRFIILCDAEQDKSFSCEGLANAIRRCRIDFGVEINIDICEIKNRDDKNFSRSHYQLGEIKYPQSNNKKATLLYIKSSLVNCITNPLPVDVMEYAQKNKAFPHQSTGDQFFDEEQFESYRKLGLHIAEIVFGDPLVLQEWQR
jgi:hypothetical protein